jgi:hypothetical protein
MAFGDKIFTARYTTDDYYGLWAHRNWRIINSLGSVASKVSFHLKVLPAWLALLLWLGLAFACVLLPASLLALFSGGVNGAAFFWDEVQICDGSSVVDGGDLAQASGTGGDDDASDQAVSASNNNHHFGHLLLFVSALFWGVDGAARPRGAAGEIFSTIAAGAGVFFAALLTTLLSRRLMKPAARFVFARTACVDVDERGIATSITFRVACATPALLAAPEVRILARVSRLPPEQGDAYHSLQVSFNNAIVSLPRTVTCTLTGTSLEGLTAEQLRNRSLGFFVASSGLDSLSGLWSSVFRSPDIEDVRFGYKFRDTLKKESEVEAQEPQGSRGRGEEVSPPTGGNVNHNDNPDVVVSLARPFGGNLDAGVARGYRDGPDSISSIPPPLRVADLEGGDIGCGGDGGGGRSAESAAPELDVDGHTSVDREDDDCVRLMTPGHKIVHFTRFEEIEWDEHSPLGQEFRESDQAAALRKERAHRNTGALASRIASFLYTRELNNPESEINRWYMVAGHSGPVSVTGVPINLGELTSYLLMTSSWLSLAAGLLFAAVFFAVLFAVPFELMRGSGQLSGLSSGFGASVVFSLSLLTRFGTGVRISGPWALTVAVAELIISRVLASLLVSVFLVRLSHQSSPFAFARYAHASLEEEHHGQQVHGHQPGTTGGGSDPVGDSSTAKCTGDANDEDASDEDANDEDANDDDDAEANEIALFRRTVSPLRKIKRLQLRSGTSLPVVMHRPTYTISALLRDRRRGAPTRRVALTPTVAFESWHLLTDVFVDFQDPACPLHNMSVGEFYAGVIKIMVSIAGIDDVAGAYRAATKVYTAADVVLGAAPCDIISTAGGVITLDFAAD